MLLVRNVNWYESIQGIGYTAATHIEKELYCVGLINEASHDADYILITHDHYDHFSVDDISKLAKEVDCDIAIIPIGGTYTMDQKKYQTFIKNIW